MFWLILCLYLFFCFCCFVSLIIQDFYYIAYSDYTFKINEVFCNVFLSLMPIVNLICAAEPLIKRIEPTVTKWIKSFNNEEA